MDQPLKLNVMHVILDLDRAGAQEVVRTLAEYQQAKGCVVTVCALYDGPMRREIEALGVTVEILKRCRHHSIFLPRFLTVMLHVRQELARLIKTHKPDIVQTHLMEIFDFVVLTLRYTTSLSAVLWTIHSVGFLPTLTTKHWLLRPKRLVYRLLYRLTASQVDGIIAVSDQVRESLIRQIGPIQNKIITICNGIDFRRFERPGNRTALCDQLGVEPDSPLIATVGRLTTPKGQRYLMEAASTIVVSYPNAHFLFIGDGELREELQSQVQMAGLVGNVHFLGNRDNVPDLLAAVDLFVLPSLWEGLSIALLEAMAAGKPIVATAVSGTTLAMIPGTTGLIVPPGDSQALAQAIVELLSHPAQAQAMGQAARQHVISNFSAQKQADEYLALYQRLVKR